MTKFLYFFLEYKCPYCGKTYRDGPVDSSVVNNRFICSCGANMEYSAGINYAHATREKDKTESEGK